MLNTYYDNQDYLIPAWEVEYTEPSGDRAIGFTKSVEYKSKFAATVGIERKGNIRGLRSKLWKVTKITISEVKDALSGPGSRRPPCDTDWSEDGVNTDACQ